MGDRFQAGPNGEGVFTVTGLSLETVTLDGNHPLAGQELYFDVEITEMRAATEEEMAHGHAHGEGGEHHH
jgi:FKBP-type peptidyl-prolyl cis-trans isomerase SlyD